MLSLIFSNILFILTKVSYSLFKEFSSLVGVDTPVGLVILDILDQRRKKSDKAINYFFILFKLFYSCQVTKLDVMHEPLMCRFSTITWNEKYAQIIASPDGIWTCYGEFYFINAEGKD